MRWLIRAEEQLKHCVYEYANGKQYPGPPGYSQQRVQELAGRVQPPGYSPQTLGGNHYAIALARPDGISADTANPKKYSPAAM